MRCLSRQNFDWLELGSVSKKIKTLQICNIHHLIKVVTLLNMLLSNNISLLSYIVSILFHIYQVYTQLHKTYIITHKFIIR